MNDARLASSGCALHEPFALQVLGTEMAPEFPDRCIVIIDPAPTTVRSGMYVFAEVEGVRWLREYVKDDAGNEQLRALDPQFPVIALHGLQWQVLGVVIQRNIRRKIKHYPIR